MICKKHLLFEPYLSQFCQAHINFMVSFQDFDPGFISAPLHSMNLLTFFYCLLKSCFFLYFWALFLPSLSVTKIFAISDMLKNVTRSQQEWALCSTDLEINPAYAHFTGCCAWKQTRMQNCMQYSFVLAIMSILPGFVQLWVRYPYALLQEKLGAEESSICLCFLL